MGDVGVALGDRDVPNDFALEVGIEFDLIPRFGEEGLEFDAVILMQHPEQWCIVLDGVCAEDGEPMH